LRSFRDRNPYIVGIISVLLIGALTGAAFSIGLLHLLENTYELKGEFSDASGLKEGDAVRLAGVKVGRVTGIGVDRQHGLVEVTFVVNHGVKLGKDTTNAEIALETLLGAKAIRLTTDVSKDCCLEDEPTSARVIPRDRTATPFDVFELTRVATRGVQELDTPVLNKVINDLADVTEGKKQTVADLVASLTTVAKAINERDVQLAELLDRADTLSGTLAEKDQTFVALIDQSKAILDLIASRRDVLATALGEGSAAVSQLSDILSEHHAALDEILSGLHPTLEVVARNQQNLNDALPTLGPAFYDLAIAGSHGPWLDVFISQLGPISLEFICQLVKADPCPI
jgi:phospholipid/cholesterol/gamma-HCH transport system substrate-binding protein